MNLILNSYGSTLGVEDGMLVVRTKDGKQVFDPKVVKTIQICKGAQITSDAALLAINSNIDVYFIDGVGMPQGRIWSNKFGSITTIRRKQLDFTLSENAVEWIKGIICEKLDNQLAMMLAFDTDNADIEVFRYRQMNRIKVYKQKIFEIQAGNIAEAAKSLRGWEGAASKCYFAVLNLFVPDMYKFKERSQHPAKDIFNALLNYGYGMLYGKIEAELIKAGIDPYIGVLHREDYNRPVLTFDVIEKFRIWIDYVVMQLVINKAIDQECFSIRDNDSVWLENLGKRILIQSVYDYLEEGAGEQKPNFSRIHQIVQYSQRLAKMFMDFEIN